ncbi:MAG: hypothetical protein HY319_23120 [Armatimonadetes bacterium]|nr:hypothetical protein [Armatimonadota bacterium]
MSHQLTPHRRRVLKAVGDYEESCGYPPSIREMSEALGKSLSTIFGHVIKLEKGGYLIRRPRKTRNIRLTEKGVLALRGTAAPETGRAIALKERVQALESALGAQLGVLQLVPWEVLREQCPYAGPLMAHTARLLEEAA